MEKTSAASEIGTISYDGAYIKTDFAQRTKHRLSPTRTTAPLVKKRRETDEKPLPFITKRKSVRRRRRIDRMISEQTMQSCVHSNLVTTKAGKHGNGNSRSRKRKHRPIRRRVPRQKIVPKVENYQVPKYHLTYEKVLNVYKAMRKGRTYHASRRVLWRNRHHLVFGSQNSYRRNSRNAFLFGNSKEKEYENNEPPEVEDDHQWLLTGPEYSSDEAGDGPVPLLKIFEETVIDPDPQWLQMGPEFSSDISADGPQQDGVSENLPIGSVPPSSGQRIGPFNPRVLDGALHDGVSENLPLGSVPAPSPSEQRTNH